MTLDDPLFEQNLTYSAAEFRTFIGALLTPGVTAVTGLKVTQSGTPAMSVDVAAGSCVIEGTDAANQGRYLCRAPATTTVAIAASPASGQSRIDLIVATVRDAAVTGPNNDWLIQAITGTATTGTPVAPTLPQSSLVLATVQVSGLVSSIVTADVTDERVLTASPLVASADTSVPPSTDGQIIGTADGHIYLGDSGSWKRRDTPGTLFSSTVPASGNYGAGAWERSGPDVTITAPGYPCIARVDWAGYIAKNEALYRVSLSGDGGATWTDGTGAYATSTSSTTYVPCATQLLHAYSGTGNISARMQIWCSKTGGADLDHQNLTLTVTPS